MTAKGFTDQGSTTADNLIAGEFPRVSGLVIITGGNYPRGTVLTSSDGSFSICGAADKPEAILAEAVDASSEDKEAIVYLTGEFNATALTVADGATVADLTSKLRDRNIFVKNNQPY